MTAITLPHPGLKEKISPADKETKVFVPSPFQLLEDVG